MTPAKRILNVTQGNTVCARAMLADRPLARMRGLLGRRQLPVGEGLLLTPAPSIHTAFMRFAIDAVFIGRDLRVLRTVERMGPWRAAFQRRAQSVLELPPGQVARTGLQVGDQLRLEDAQAQQQTRLASVEPAQASVEPVIARRKLAGADQPEQTQSHTHRVDSAMRVMVLSPDRRFREVTCLLLARRGCLVSTGEGAGTLAERIDRDRTDVVVIDAGRSLAAAARMAAAVDAHSRPVGVVVVRDESQSALTRLPTILKWGSFETLFSAIAEAHAGHEHFHALQGACPPEQSGPS
jgi:uncharacterized protein